MLSSRMIVNTLKMSNTLKKITRTSGIEIKQLKTALSFVNELPIYLSNTFKFYAVEIAEKKLCWQNYYLSKICTSVQIIRYENINRYIL